MVAGAFAQDRPTAEPVRMDLAGEWRFLPSNGPASFAGSDVDDHDWPTMRLPSNWFLHGARTYPRNADRTEAGGSPGQLWPIDPERGLDWAGAVWFRREAEWAGGGSRPVILELDMVDYYCDVFVNGIAVGSHEGYFQRWAVNVSRAIRRGRNSIALKVTAPALPFDMAARFPLSWPKQQNMVKGIFGYHDTRPGATSGRGQERSTGGVLREVTLRESAGIEIEGISVTTRSIGEGPARLAIEARVRNWTSAPVRVVIRGQVRAGNFPSWDTSPVELRTTAAPGLTRVAGEASVSRPRLWWSWDYGRPNLYRLEAQLLPVTGATVLDTASVTFGIRTISRDSSWVWRLNGKRIYPRGTNYIATQWLSQADHEWYARDVDMMRAANLNTIRVHAHLARPEFYEVADSVGMMVWQDFPLQWGYADTPDFRNQALRQAGDMLDRYGGYSSIIVWCMHNESPHAMTWMEKHDPKQNLALDEALVALVARRDPSRVHHRDSGTGDGHPYPGWYGGSVADYAKLPKELFITEYGAQALPNLESLRETFPSDTVLPNDTNDWAEWRFHDFQPEQTFEIAGISRGNTLQEFIESSQRYQAQVVRYGTEIFRRAKWQGNTGIYQFMFVDDWPSITWSVVDYFRRTKPGYEALRRAMQPILVSIEYRIEDRDAPIALHVVNDLHSSLTGAVLHWRVVQPDGRIANQAQQRLDVAADTAANVVALGSLPAVTREASLLETWLEHGGRVLGRNTLSASDFR